MGGRGSGRTRGWGAPVVEDARVIDVDDFGRKTFPVPHLHCSGSCVWSNVATGQKTGSIGFEVRTTADTGWLRLEYTVTHWSTSAKRTMDYRVELVTTRPHFGGLRWWFLCPLSGRRVRKLYLHGGCDYFVSRQALGLTYTSCREDESDRALRRTQKLLVRLGGTGSLLELDWHPKPKGMHWRTYERLSMAARAASAPGFSGVLRRLGILSEVGS